MELGIPNAPKIKVLDGRLPAISTDGNLISYMSTSHKFCIFDIESKRSWRVGTNIFSFEPAVWISDKTLIYITTDQHMKVIDAISGEISGSWPDGVFPVALSPDGKTVLCSTRLPDTRLLLYKTDGSYIDTITNLGIYYRTWPSVWSSNGRSFIYERRSFFGFYPSLDTYDVYMFNIDTGKEKRIVGNVILNGAVCIGPSNTTHTETETDSEIYQTVDPTTIHYQIERTRNYD